MKNRFAQSSAVILLLVISLWACRKQELVINTNSELNITGYLDSDPDQFSEFRKILSLTGNAGFLNAYGAYTLFLPNNAAVKDYLQTTGKATVGDVDLNILKDLVKFQLIEDTLTTNNFKDGKLPTLTMYGQYLITGTSNTNGITVRRINRQANLVKGDIIVGNGIIHVIDKMLIPANKTVAQLVETDPKYSIFTQVLKATSIYDSLNIAPDKNGARRFTLLAETDSTLKAAGYANFAALKARFSKTGDPTKPNDSLRIYAEFHILQGAKYLADIISTTAHETEAPAEVITAKLSNTKVLINDDDFNGKHETGITLNRNSSDNSATNGVLHTTAPYTASGVTSTGHLAIKVRVPLRLDWDIADFPENRALPSIFRRASNEFKKPVKLSTITASDGVSSLFYTYKPSAPLIYGDMLEIPTGPTSRTAAFTFTTPLLVKGKYKVWICYEYYRKSSSNPSYTNQISIDGVPMQRTYDGIAKRPAGSEAELESQGWKQYINGNTSTNYNGRLLGTIDLPSTKTYSFEIKWVGGASGDLHVDVVQFIPVDQNQIHPMINPDGTLEY
ncbi:MAG: fasciclin domain-containing protein [Pelobium sp.]